MCPVTNIIGIFAAQFELLSIQLERKALLKTGWWSQRIASNTTSDHCRWAGVTCNTAGSSTEIILRNKQLKGKFGRLNFSCLPNLGTSESRDQ